MSADTHVIPIADWMPHVAARECVCRPTIEIVNLEGDAVVTHHAADGREYFEDGGPAVPNETVQ